MSHRASKCASERWNSIEYLWEREIHYIRPTDSLVLMKDVSQILSKYLFKSMPERNLKGRLSHRQAKDLSCVYKAELKPSYWNMHTFILFKKMDKKRSAVATARKKCQTLCWLGSLLTCVHSWAQSRDGLFSAPARLNASLPCPPRHRMECWASSSNSWQ